MWTLHFEDLGGLSTAMLTFVSDGVYLNTHGLAKFLEKSVTSYFYTTEVYADCIVMMPGASGYLSFFHFFCIFFYILLFISDLCLYICVFCKQYLNSSSCCFL